MKYFISSVPHQFTILYDFYKQFKCKYLLLSYFYIQKLGMKNKEALFDKLLDFKKLGGEFMLDSGVFSFFSKQEIKEKFLDQYLESYIGFIKENYALIDYFVEFDLDVILGYEQVKKIQRKLVNVFGYEKLIAVWHPERGWEGFENMLKEFKYIAFGLSNIYRTEIPDHLIDKMTIFAKNSNVKVHGLAYTRRDVHKRFFDSVDSSSFCSGAKFGSYLNFVNFDIKLVKKIRYKDHNSAIKFNLQNHLKLQQFLDKINNYDLLKLRYGK